MTPRRERGSATVQAAFLVGLLTVTALLAAAVVAVLVAHRRAASAADLAALAGASALQHGQPGCEAAAAIADANVVRLVSCETSGDVLTIHVAAEVRVFTSHLEVDARARAGPVR